MCIRPWLIAAALALAGCATAPPSADQDIPAALLIGEQHDAADHQVLHRDVIDAFALRGLLAGVVLEMALRGRSTAGLPADATEEQVRAALGWNREGGWSWPAYGPAIMAAVRAGVPVQGANLSREDMRDARADASLETRVPPQALSATLAGVRAGHCDLLPETQLAPMARIQIARDRAMAAAVAEAAKPGRTVILLAGSGHVHPELGVPLHLPPGMRALPVLLPRVNTGKDYCADLRRQLPNLPAMRRSS